MAFPRQILPVALVAGALVASVAGCTAVGPGASSSSSTSAPTTSAPVAGSSAGAGQSKAGACRILGSSLQDLSNSLQSAYSKYASDPKAAAADLQKVTDTFTQSVSKVTAPDAKALTDKAQTDLQSLITATKDAVDHPITGVAKVQKLVPAIKSDFTKIGSYCS